MDKKPITISLNPSYFCSERCHFCYLTEEQLSDKKRLDLNRLKEMLAEVSQYYQIEHIDLYGGEPALLPRPYIEVLKSILSEYVEEVNVNTNFIKVPDWMCNDSFWYISVSWDGVAREKSEKVRENIIGFDRAVSIVSLASREMIDQIEKIVGVIAWMSTEWHCINSWEIKPYSSNQSNQLGITYLEYEEAIRRASRAIKEYSGIKHCFGDDVVFVNQELIEEAREGNRNAFSSDHVYITPNGRFAVLEFDLNDNEYFLEMDTVEEYMEWVNKEFIRVSNNEFCSRCAYFGRCLTEHYREVKDLSQSCNGFYNLIKK